MIVLSLLITMPLVAASLGTFKQNKCVDIKTIINSSSVTLSTINSPASKVVLNTKSMQNIAGKTWNYTFCSTDQIGTYNYDYYDAEGNVYVNSFDITPSGNVNNPNFLYIIILFSIGIIVLGFAIQNGWITILGDFGLVYLGLYIILYGINGIKDTVYTWGFGIIVLAIAGYIGIRSAYEMIEEIDLR